MNSLVARRRGPDDSAKERSVDDRAARAIVDALDDDEEEAFEADVAEEAFEAEVVHPGEDNVEGDFDLGDDADPRDASAQDALRSSEYAEVYGRILSLATGRGALGVTSDDVATIFGHDDTLSVAPRITELRRFGYLLPNGLRRITRKGGTGEVLIVSPDLLPAPAPDVENGESRVAEVEILPSAYWRCRLCTTDVEVPVDGRAPSVCRSCGQIGTLVAMSEDYEPAPPPQPRRPQQSPFATGGGYGSLGGPTQPQAPFGVQPFAPRGRRRQEATIVDPAEVEREPLVRSPSGVSGLDHVTGGGIAQGYVVMVAGPPGCGKSTICTQAASGLAHLGTHFGAGVAYGAAEEDADAVIETADRVAIANFKIVLATSCQTMIEGLDETDSVVWVIDSLMAITSDEVDGEPGLPSQINACSTLLFQRAHAMPGSPFEGMQRRSIYLVAHGTKDGNMAGPLKALHSVDGGVLMEHVDPTGADTKGNAPWAPVKDQTRPTGFVSARVYRKMRKSSNRPIAYFLVQPEFLDEAATIRNPIGGRLDRVQGPEAAQ